MKRIVNGVTYNTDTSTALAESRWESDQDEETLGTLYQTRGGAYFVDLEITKKEWNEREQEAETVVTHSFVPKSPENAHAWMLDGEVEVFHNPFDDPPEAAAESEPASTIYIRVPASLKQRVDEAAREGKLSGNTWAMRCVEQCLSGFPEQISKIWYIASVSRAWTGDPPIEGDDYKCKTAVRALEEITCLVEEFAKDRFGTDNLVNIDGFLWGHEVEEIQRRYKPYEDS